MSDISHDETPAAVRLTLALTHMRARLREEASASATGLSMSQLAIVQRLLRGGPTTAASLAAAEHVSQQAIAQSVAVLKATGLVESSPDPTDGRKTLISVTNAGHELRESIGASRNSWLNRAIGSTIAPDEMPALDKAIELLERLADAGV